MAEKLISKIPEGPLSEKWTKHKSQIRVVSPGNKRKLEVIVVGTGLGAADVGSKPYFRPYYKGSAPPDYSE